MPTGGIDTEEEFIAVDGIVASGEYGSGGAPTNAVGALDTSWTDHGLTTAAGVTRSAPASRSVRRAWQKNIKLRTVTTEAAVRFVFTLVQTNAANVGFFHGVPLVAGSLVTDPSREWPLIKFDFDQIDGDNNIREYAPRARIVEVGDQVSLAGDNVGYPITVEAEYDSGIEGYTKLFYSEFETIPVPTISTALPASQGAGEIVHLVGTGFSSATGVTVGGVPVAAGNFDAYSDTEMYITLPAGSSGSAPIIVTGPGGASSGKTYTRT